MLKKILLLGILLLMVPAGLNGCRNGETYLTPGQVDDAMLGTVIRVKGKISYVVVNPMGVGGLYMTLQEGDCEVGVRVQEDVREGMTDEEQALYREGRTVLVEGVLQKVGAVFVIVHGKYEVSSNTTMK